MCEGSRVLCTASVLSTWAHLTHLFVQQQLLNSSCGGDMERENPIHSCLPRADSWRGSDMTIFYVFFWGSEVLNFSQLLEGVASLLAEKFTWNYTLGGKKKRKLPHQIHLSTNKPFLNCWPLPSVSHNVAGTLSSNKDPCYLIRMYLLKVIMVYNRYLAMWNTIPSFKMWRFGA